MLKLIWLSKNNSSNLVRQYRLSGVEYTAFNFNIYIIRKFLPEVECYLYFFHLKVYQFIVGFLYFLKLLVQIHHIFYILQIISCLVNLVSVLSVFTVRTCSDLNVDNIKESMKKEGQVSWLFYVYVRRIN